MAAKYKLIYFDVKGRGEIARLLLAAAGQEYKDLRLPFNMAFPGLSNEERKKFKEWEQWAALKASMPFEQIPVLEVTDENGQTLQIAQTLAIARHLARVFGFYGKTITEQSLIDMYGDQITDLLNEGIRVQLFEQDPAKKKALGEAFFTETLPRNLGYFERQTAKNGANGHLVGAALSWVDVYLYTFLEFLRKQHSQVVEALLANFPNVKKLEETVQTNAGIAEWLKKRPETAI